ncbi:hypothetical protein Aperf_G00000130328 [Anoplocephala perfoliata]
MEDIFVATERALVFMLRNYQTMNLDGAMGIRILQGTYNQLIEAYGTDLPEGFVEKLQQLERLADEAGALGAMTAAMKTPFYFSKAGFLLEAELWQFLLPKRPLELLPTSKMEQILRHDDVPEDLFDYCFHEFVGNDLYNHCNISNKCFTNMNADKFSSYSLTHQVLYYLVGLGAGCEAQLIDMVGRSLAIGSVESQLRRFCSRIDAEARTLAENDFPKEMRDLFMEQVGVCGIAGFTQIARPEWIDQILKWQSPTSGCFHEFLGENLDPENFDPHRYGNYRRRRRSEMKMNGGGNGSEVCLSHRTAVALMALSAYTRRMAEQFVGT